MDLKSANILCQVLGALRDHCTPDALRTLTMSSKADDEIDLPAIQPSLVSHGLQHVEFSIVIVMDDYALEQLALAWPRPSKLVLEGPCSEVIPSITLSGLLPLMKHCPELELLSITLDSRHPPFSENRRPGNGISNPHLRNVVFLGSPIDQCYKVAAFLSGIFPNLKDVDIEGD